MRWGGKRLRYLHCAISPHLLSSFLSVYLPSLSTQDMSDGRFSFRSLMWSMSMFARVLVTRMALFLWETQESLPPSLPPLSPLSQHSVSLLRCVSYVFPDATFGSPPRRRCCRRRCRRCCCVPSSSAVSLLSPSSSSPVSSAFPYLLRSVSPWATFFCRAVLHRDYVPLWVLGV